MKTKKLPEGWKEVELGRLFDFQKKSKIKAGEGSKKGKYKFFTSSDKQTKFIDEYNQDGEYLIFATGGHAGIHYCNEKFATSTDCFIVKVDDKVLAKYVYYYLFSKIQLLEEGFKGAGLKHISKGYIQDIKLFYPENIETQKKIVSLLEKAERSKEWRKEADKLTDEYLKSVFLEMFFKRYDVVFDNNLIINLEERRDGWGDVKELQEYEKKGKLKIHIPVIVGSEKKIDGSFIINYYKFIDFIKNQGFKESTKLKPLCILGLCYNNFSLPSNKKMANKLEEIFYFLFPDREFDYSTFCKNKGIDPKIKPLHKNWRRYIIDAMLLWSCDYYKIPYLVTRDKHFLNKKEEIKQKYNIEILEPKELILEIEKRNFEKVELGNKNLFEIQSGGTPSRTKKEYWNNGKIPWIGSTACKDFPISKSKQFITEKGLKNSSTRLFPKNTILVALVGATIGKTGILKFECATNQNIAGINIKDKKRIDKIYLFFMLQSLYHKFLSLSSDSFKMANLSFVRSLKIPLPPIELQNKFASIVKEVEAIKEHQKKSREEINNLFNALMQKAFKGELRC